MAVKIVPLDQVASVPNAQPASMPLSTVNSYTKQKYIDPVKFDTWVDKFMAGLAADPPVEKAIRGATAPKGAVGVAGDVGAGALMNVSNLVNDSIAAGLVITGEVMDEEVDKSGFVEGSVDVGRRYLKNIQNNPVLGPVGGLLSAITSKGAEAFGRAKRQIAASGDNVNEDGDIDAADMIDTADRSWRTNVGKRIAHIGFTMHLKNKQFREQIDPQIDSQLAFDVGGGLASLTRTIAIGMFNPQVAMALMTGEVSTQKFLETRAAGVDFVPSLTFSVAMGGVMGPMEKITLGVLKARNLKFMEVVGKTVIANAIEEGAQGAVERAGDKAIGLVDTQLWEDVRDTLYEALIGGIVGGVGGATVVNHSYKKVRQAVEDEFESNEEIRKAIPEAGDRKRAAGQLARELRNMNYDVGSALIADMLGVTEEDMDAVESLVEGRGDAKENLTALMSKKRAPIEINMDQETMDRALTETVVEDTTVQDTPLTPEETKQAEDLIIKEKALRKGREAQLDQDRIAIEKDLAFNERELELRTEEGKPTAMVEARIEKLNAKLDDVHRQLSDLIDDTVREIELEVNDVKLRGAVLERLRVAARAEGEREERAKLTQEAKAAREGDARLRDKIVKYAKKYLPPSQRGAVLTDLNKPKVTPAMLRDAMAKINRIREATRKGNFIERITNSLERVSPKKGASGNEKGGLGSANLQAVANHLLRLANMTQEEASQAKGENIAKLDAAMRGDLDMDAATFDALMADNERIDMLADFQNKSGDDLEKSARWLEANVQNLIATGKFLREMRAEIVDQSAQIIVGEIQKPNASGEDLSKLNAMQKASRTITSFLQGALYNYRTALDLLIRTKDKNASFVKTQLIDRMDQAQRYNHAVLDTLSGRMTDLYKNAFGLKDEREYRKQRAKDASYDPKDGAFVSDIQTLDGKTHKMKLNRSTLRYWYMVSHHPDGQEHSDIWEVFTDRNAVAALNEKVESGEIEIDSIQYRKAVSDLRGNKIPEAEFRRIMDLVRNSPEDLEFIKQQRAYYGRLYAMLNPVYRRVFGTDLPKEANYVPWLRDVNQDAEFSVVGDIGSRFNFVPGFVKTRTKGAMAPFKQVGDMDVMESMAMEMAHFLGFYPIVADTVRILKHKDVRDAINTATDGALRPDGTIADGQYYRNILKMVEMIGTRGRKHVHIFHRIVSALNNNITRSALGAKGTIGAIQITSSLLAMDYVTPKSFVEGIGDLMANPKDAIALLQRSPSRRMRDGNFIMELQDIAKVQNAGKWSKFVKNYDTAMFFFVRAGNRAGIVLGGWTVFRATYLKTGDINKAYEQFDSFMDSTQQSSAHTEMSLGQVSAMRPIFKFLSQPLQILRKEVVAFNDWKRGRISLGEAARKILIFHFIIPMIVETIRAVFKPDSRNVVTSLVLGPFAAVPLYSDMIEGLVMATLFGEKPRKADLTPAIVAPFTDMPTDIYRIAAEASESSPELGELLDHWLELGQDVGAIAGAPSILFETAQTGVSVAGGDLSPMSIPGALAGWSRYRLHQAENPKKGKRRSSSTLGVRR